MDQTFIHPPEVNSGPGYCISYNLYLHCTAWALRKAVASVTGTGELYDRLLSVSTPGLGEGKVDISVCTPKDHNISQGPLPLLMNIQGGGFILGQPTDGEHIDRSVCDEVSQ